MRYLESINGHKLIKKIQDNTVTYCCSNNNCSIEAHGEYGKLDNAFIYVEVKKIAKKSPCPKKIDEEINLR